MTFVYGDPETGTQRYTMESVKGGMVISTAAGMTSSMAGVGGGMIKVPITCTWMSL